MLAKILIVDDDHALCKIMKEVLEREGYQVATGATVREGLDQLKKSAPDLVFLDIRLPDGDGIQFLERMRKRHFTMPVFIFTGYADLQTAQQALRFGATEYLAKPIDLKQIKEIIRNTLDLLGVGTTS